MVAKKEVTKVSIVVPMLLIPILMTNGLKGCLSWNSPLSPRANLSFEAKIVPLLSFCDETRTVTPHQFYLCFLLVIASQKIYIKQKKSGWYKLYFFKIWITWNFAFRATANCEVMLKLSISLHFFQDRVIWSHLTEKYSPEEQTGPRF